MNKGNHTEKSLLTAWLPLCEVGTDKTFHRSRSGSPSPRQERLSVGRRHLCSLCVNEIKKMNKWVKINLNEGDLSSTAYNSLCTIGHGSHLMYHRTCPATEERIKMTRHTDTMQFYCCCSVAKSCLTLWPHGLQHPRFLCPSPSPGFYSNSCSLSRGGHSTISSSVAPFSSYLQSFPASGSFPMSWLFPSFGQSTGASASASVLPMKIQDWFPLRWTGLISLSSKGLSRVFSSITIQKHQFFSVPPSLWS